MLQRPGIGKRSFTGIYWNDFLVLFDNLRHRLGKTKKGEGSVMRTIFVFAAMVVAAVISVTAEAQPLTTTKYQYYSINGASALEVYKSMLVHGPRVNGAKAYAATSAQTSPAGYA